MKKLLQETLDAGYKHFKLKVGGNLEDDKRRLTIAREILGYDKGNVLMVDANQVLPRFSYCCTLTKRRYGPFQRPYSG
jgi:L-alanine-DL-glutamate epimerase-like enolase superfamily enzyme